MLPDTQYLLTPQLRDSAGLALRLTGFPTHTSACARPGIRATGTCAEALLICEQSIPHLRASRKNDSVEIIPCCILRIPSRLTFHASRIIWFCASHIRRYTPFASSNS